MKIVVIGSGLIGIATAYFLGCRGHEVTVIDQEPGPGRGTSFANGSLLTPSMSEPWNAPGSWRVLLASLGRPDSAMQLRLRAVPSLAGWGIEFLRNSTPAIYRQNSLNNLRLARHSLAVTHSLRQEIDLDYDNAAAGSLRIFRDPAALERAVASASTLTSQGLRLRTLSRAQAVELEPGLEPIAAGLAGAIHYEDDETGNAYEFCLALAEQARRRGVTFLFGVQAAGLESRSARVTAVRSHCGRLFTADRYVVAAGSYSTPLLRSVGIRLPVRPVKGYSITIDTSGTPRGLDIPVVDDDLHAVVVPLANAIRVAGTAEFTGYDLRPNATRTHNLLGLLRAVLPRKQFDSGSAKPWCGLRAMAADGVPLVGTTRISNLLVSTGHGHLGWTMAAGSGQLLAELICGETPSIDPAAFAPTRFAAGL